MHLGIFSALLSCLLEEKCSASANKHVCSSRKYIFYLPRLSANLVAQSDIPREVLHFAKPISVRFSTSPTKFSTFPFFLTLSVRFRKYIANTSEWFFGENSNTTRAEILHELQDYGKPE